MDLLTFISEITDSLVWPIVAVVALFLLKKPLSELIPLLRKLKWKDFEAEFGREIEGLRSRVNQALPEVPGVVPSEPTIGLIVQKFSQLAELSPRSVVLEAWKEVESEALQTAQRNEIPLNYYRPLSPVVIGRALTQGEILEENQLEIFNILRTLRNKVAHAEEFAFSKDDALEYADMADRLIRYLRSR